MLASARNYGSDPNEPNNRTSISNGLAEESNALQYTVSSGNSIRVRKEGDKFLKSAFDFLVRQNEHRRGPLKSIMFFIHKRYLLVRDEIGNDKGQPARSSDLR